MTDKTGQNLYVCIIFNADNAEDMPVLILPILLKLALFTKVVLDDTNLKLYTGSSIFENVKNT